MDGDKFEWKYSASDRNWEWKVNMLLFLPWVGKVFKSTFIQNMMLE